MVSMSDHRYEGSALTGWVPPDTGDERRWRAEFAGSIVARALAKGFLKKLPCAMCGTTEDLEAHHEDYSRPLDVEWLCFRHHRELGHGHTISADAPYRNPHRRPRKSNTIAFRVNDLDLIDIKETARIANRSVPNLLLVLAVNEGRKRRGEKLIGVHWNGASESGQEVEEKK